MKIAFSSPKTITQRWDTLAFYEHFNYITQDFSVGSAYGRYGQQDKLINISMASPKRLCDITVVGDITDEPYGKNKTPDKSGHQKPKHLPVIFNPVQENGSLMVLADCKLSGEKNANCIATNILLPGNADNIEINGQIVPISGITEIPFNLTDVLVIREGNTALFIKVFELEGYNNAQPQIVLIADSIGLKDSTIRLVLYHTREHIDKLKNVSLRAGILFSMDQYKKETDFSSALSRFSKTSILQTKDDHSWYAKAVVDKHTLEVQRENNSFKTIIRKIDGRGKISDPLTINGKSIQLAN